MAIKQCQYIKTEKFKLLDDCLKLAKMGKFCIPEQF